MDWTIFWTATAAIAAIVTIAGGIFKSIRKSETDNMQLQIDAMDTTITNLVENINKKLDEVEFRRFEDRNERAIQTIIEKADSRIDKLDQKLDEKFDKLYDILNKRS